MIRTAVPAAIEKRLDVPLSPRQAFELFTAGLARWWPMASYSLLEGAAAAFVFGAAIGEPVCEVGADGSGHLWGTITEWNPPCGFAMTWHPGHPAERATRLRVQFQALAGGGTRIELRHDGWEALGADAGAARERYDGGWPRVLAALAGASRISA